MKILSGLILSFSLLVSISGNASSLNSDKEMLAELLFKFETPIKKENFPAIKKSIFSMGNRSVPVLTQVMREEKFPEKNRWMATFLLAQVMGDKSAAYISRYSQHPNWLMRMASLKALTALKQNDLGPVFAKALKDNALLVRVQALESIKTLNLTKYAPHVWAVLYDKRNYYETKVGNKRANIIKMAVTTVGDLKFEKAKPALYKMVSSKKYEDIFPEMDYALTKITGKKSPEGNLQNKRQFWSRQNMNDVII